VAANHPRPKVWSNSVPTNASSIASSSVDTNVARSVPIVTRSASDPTHSGSTDKVVPLARSASCGPELPSAIPDITPEAPYAGGLKRSATGVGYIGPSTSGGLTASKSMWMPPSDVKLEATTAHGGPFVGGGVKLEATTAHGGPFVGGGLSVEVEVQTGKRKRKIGMDEFLTKMAEKEARDSEPYEGKSYKIVVGIHLPYNYAPKRNKDVLKLLNKLTPEQLTFVMERGFLVRNGDLDDKQLKSRIRELREQFNLPKPKVKDRWKQAAQLDDSSDAVSTSTTSTTRIKAKKRRTDKIDSKGDREHEVFQASRDKFEAYDEVSDQLEAERKEANAELAEWMSSS
jgi:hypothetical protein